MPALPDSLPAGKLLHASDVHAVDAGAVVREQRCKWSTDDLRAVHHADRVSEKSVPVGEDSVVDVEVFKDLDDGERGARQDRLLSLGLGV